MRATGLFVAVGLVVLACGAGVAPAQDLRAPLRSPILVIDQERLFAESVTGQARIEQSEAETAALAAENRRIENELTIEESDLTEQRAQMPPEEFRALAEAFDAKVVAIRRAQDTKARSLGQQRENAQQNFYREILPLIAELAAERGAVAVLDRGVVLMSADQIDITDAAIALIDGQRDMGATADDADATDTAQPDPSDTPLTPDQP